MKQKCFIETTLLLREQAHDGEMPCFCEIMKIPPKRQHIESTIIK